MKVRWLGWAGVELEHEGATVVVDPLLDAGAVFAPLGAPAGDGTLPRVVPPAGRRAVAGLLTHLHRDHADAAALASALAEGAPVLEPRGFGGEAVEGLGLLQADRELTAAGLERRPVAWWETVVAGPFTITALPAVDGLGDPQVSWLVQTDEHRVLHCGDTMAHGYWWRFAQRFGPVDLALLPVNGAVVDFPHRQPASTAPVAMTPRQAAEAARILGARVAAPIHAEGYDVRGTYAPEPDAAGLFADLASSAGVATVVPVTGERFDLAPVHAVGRGSA